VWEDLVAEYNGTQLEMAILDNDDSEDRAFARSHGVNYQPGFIVVEPGGAVLHAALGPYDGDSLRTLIESFISN
jgi:hypothetical protein